MSSNPLSKLVAPRYPAAGVGIESATATVVQLERRRRDGFTLRRAATITLPRGLIRPSFDERNISDVSEAAESLADLVTSAGLLRQHKWSAALPEAASRAVILTLESAPASRAEMDEILRWKTERAFGVPLEELRIGRERLRPDAQGHVRYLATAMRLNVLEEYEAVFDALGWRVGLILPRHIGEEQWLLRNGHRGDGLLLSAHAEGFTAVLLRDAQPLIVRSVICEEKDCDDELYRLLLFYRDRLSHADEAAEARSLEHLLVVGDDFSKERVSEIVSETLGVGVSALEAADVGLSLPAGEFSFDAIAAPAGLATLAWK
ncbi:MAG TPA: hypothetical protein VD966_04885 [Pyrinomonadaceae bacterium]|nr:hypothetical protein [Pyrinomonadaceae bacterium]